MPVAVAAGTPIPTPAAAAPLAAARDVLLPVTFVEQPASNLCWAACGAMVLAYMHHPVPAFCAIQSAVLPWDCCNRPDPTRCNQPAWPATMYAAFGYTCTPAGGPISLDSLRAWIAALWPVQVYYQWDDDQGSHTALIAGLYANGKLHVLDPEWGIGPASYQYVLRAYGKGSWQETWYHIRPDDAAIS